MMSWHLESYLGVNLYLYLLMVTVLEIGNTDAIDTKRIQKDNYQSNVTLLLDNLLQNYDNKIRPDFGGEWNSPLTIIYIRTIICMLLVIFWSRKSINRSG